MESSRREPRIPLSTYRLQLRRGVTFGEAAALVPYLSQLGITDCYCSPCLTARPGSPHGYDVVDHTRADAALGGQEGFDAFAAELRRHGMGLILDFVPNHMAIDARTNLWWHDVLENGPSSPFASFFDIDWDPLKPELKGKLLLPILGDRYGEVLERGELRLELADGVPRLRYYDHFLPIRHREDLAGELPDLNGEPGNAASFDRLHDLLQVQAYRLAYWRTASHEINYRRFFDVNDLAGLRMEDPAVFEATHSLILRFVHEKKVTGLRLDHVDGLFDPEAYLDRLRAAAGPLYVVAEKILMAGEALPDTWKLDGTTGYDFLNQLNGLFVDSRRGAELRGIYHRFTTRRAPFPIVAYVGKKLIIETTMASELNVLAHALNRISERSRRSRDFTLESLKNALTEIVACFPAYRTYVNASGWTESDARTIDSAISRARRRNPAMEPSIFDFVRAALLPGSDGDSSEHERRSRLDFAMKFQQYTAPVEAKGVEDTAFYRYNVLLSVNEVGGHPEHFGRAPSDFHHANRRRLERWPGSMLASSTHDTKRGEDARARLNVLSEIPAEWRTMVSTWSRWNAAGRSRIGSEWAPDRNDEYLYYQSLLGTWPAGETEASEDLVRRLSGYMLKAAKEAKLHTSWINDNRAYDEAVTRFVTETLAGRRSRGFLARFLPFQQRIARAGMVNSLAQLVLKLASPGVPDFYQGSELWDLSLADPDNRRPVEFAERLRLLNDMEAVLDQRSLSARRLAAVTEMLEHWEDGRIKLYLTVCALRLRRRLPDLFLRGEYLPLEAADDRREHVVAFARKHADVVVVAIAPRLTTALATADHPLPLGRDSWRTANIPLPPALEASDYVNVLTGETVAAELPLAAVLGACPVALLVSERAVS